VAITISKTVRTHAANADEEREKFESISIYPGIFKSC